MIQEIKKLLALQAGLKITGRDKHGNWTFKGDEEAWKTFDDLTENYDQAWKTLDDLTENYDRDVKTNTK
jgi:hypothetical protein